MTLPKRESRPRRDYRAPPGTGFALFTIIGGAMWLLFWLYA
jgi:hypothetical protein